LEIEYCHYILSLCADVNYGTAVPKGFRMRQNIIDQFHEQFQFKEGQWQKYNRWLVDSLYYAIVKGDYILERELDEDARKIYMRCNKLITNYRANFPMDYAVDHDMIFEIANDFNWLLASKKEHERKNLMGQIKLNDDMMISRRWIVTFLEDLKKIYQEKFEECPYMEEALKKRRSIVAWSRDEKVRWYVSQHLSNEELEDWITETKDTMWKELYLFYILMVTAVRFENMRRRLK